MLAAESLVVPSFMIRFVGVRAGGTKITLRGQRFSDPITVLVSGLPCAPVEKGHPTTFVVCTLPAAAGADATISLTARDQVRAMNAVSLGLPGVGAGCTLFSPC